MEIWKDIIYYKGLYQVSNKGRVRSLDRVIYNKNMVSRKIKGIVLKPCHDGKKYLKVVLSKNDKPKTFRIHQLVAMAFLNHTPKGHELVVDHKDNNQSNNRLSNLQLITQKLNSNKDRL